MKHLLSVLLLLFITLTTVKAQDEPKSSSAAAATGFHFAAGINLGLPIGDFGDSHSFGVGVEVQPEYMLSKMFSIQASAGYTEFFGKKIGSFKIDDVGLIPILVGVKVYPAEQFFIGFKAGLGVLTGSGNSESAFDYQPQVGYNAEKFQINLGYNGLSKDGETLSNLSLSLLYKF